MESYHENFKVSLVIDSVLVEVNLKLNYISFCAIDIDECSNNTDNCDVNAFCNNTMGSHNCTCNPGYTGNGTWCTGKISHLLTFQISLNYIKGEFKSTLAT